MTEHNCKDYFEDSKGQEFNDDTIAIIGHCTKCDQDITLVYDFVGYYKGETWVRDREDNTDLPLFDPQKSMF